MSLELFAKSELTTTKQLPVSRIYFTNFLDPSTGAMIPRLSASFFLVNEFFPSQSSFTSVNIHPSETSYMGSHSSFWGTVLCFPLVQILIWKRVYNFSQRKLMYFRRYHGTWEEFTDNDNAGSHPIWRNLSFRIISFIITITKRNFVSMFSALQM